MTTPNVTAALIQALDTADVNTCAVLPAEAARTLPIARLEEAGGPESSTHTPNWLFAVTFQLDVWGNTKESAWDHYAAVRDVLLALDPSQPSAVLSRVAVGSPTWIPDESWTSTAGRPMPRYLAYVRTVARPTTP